MGRDKLAIELTVTVGATAHRIAGGDVRELDLHLTSYGMEGRVAFDVADNTAEGGRETDALRADIGKPDPIEVAISITAIPTDAPITAAPPPLAIKGLVRGRSVVEHDTRATRGVAVLSRTYELEIVDPPRLLWGQHHPVELVTGQSLRAVIAAHKGERIAVDDQWDELAPALPMIFLPLDPSLQRASFYDFVLWLVDTRNGVWAWDHRTSTVKLSAAKVDPSETIRPWRSEIAEPRTRWPEVPRQTVWVRNSFTGGPLTSKADATPSAIAGIRHDFLVTTPIADEASTRLTRERGRVITRGPLTTLRYHRFPAQPFVPGDLVELAADHGWSKSFFGAGQPLRCLELDVSARRIDDGVETHLAPGAAYEVAATAVLEPQAEPHVTLPPYAAPRYPLRAEGTIVSEVGEDQDLTWQVYTDQQTSIDGYKVAVPLWKTGDAAPQIAAPFQPGFTAGQLYLPAYKGSRVLLELELDRATIVRFLDWRSGARLPVDGQGDGLLLGKSPASSTALTHTYEDASPVFRLLRTHDKDVELLEIKEGSMLLQVKPTS